MWENRLNAPSLSPSPGVRPSFPGLLPVGPVSLFMWAVRPDRVSWGVWVLKPGCGSSQEESVHNSLVPYALQPVPSLLDLPKA